MFNKLKKILIYGLVSALLLQTAFALTLLNPQKAQAYRNDGLPDIVINEVMVNPNSGESEWVELYNQNNEDYSLDGYSIVSIGAILNYDLTGLTIEANGYVKVEMSGNKLVNAGDDLTLKYSDGITDLDQVTYGANPYTHMMSAPERGKTIGRVSDGANNWYVNLVPTPEASNNLPENELPARIDCAKIPVTATNPENTINNANVDNVNTEFTYNKEITTDTTETILLTSAKVVMGNNASTFLDGNLYLAGKVTRGTISTEYLPVTDGAAGQEIIKNTSVPTAEFIAKPYVLTNETTANFTVGGTDVVAFKYSLDGASYVETDGLNLSLTNLTNGLHTISVLGKNGVLNWQDKSSPTTYAWTVDTIAPVGTIAINNNATLTSSNLVNLNFTASADTQNMKISNFENFSGANWEPYAVTKLGWNLIAGNGQKDVYVKFQDQAGNESIVYSATIILNSNSTNVITNNVFTGSNVLFPTPELELDINGLTNVTLTTAYYNQNPGTNLPTGITAFGKYYEIALSKPFKDTISGKATIKIYYTQADLDRAGISQNKLVGLYYFDSKANVWKLFEDTGVNNNVVTLNGITYAGYLWANTDHFTPVSAGFDITAPAKPANFTATAKDGEINLTWEKVSDAKGYFVRYREGTSIDNKPYQTIYLAGADSTSTKATGLKNGVLYEFGIKSVDNFNNESEWAVVVATPVTEAILASSQTTVLKSTAEATPSTSVDQGKSAEIKTVNPEDGTVKSENEMKTSTRFWITLLILVIAAGAAYGGYYAYQWWTTKPKKEKVKVKKPTPPTPKSTEKGGRW
ncbi:MAG: lamin tail domain-containing protein [Patescibacteria group bacterium]|nr:lamin tail domain-containing protein [Patescibacteria group bacterium]